MRHEISDFTLRERVAEQLPEIRCRRDAAKNLAGSRTIGVRQTKSESTRQEQMVPDQFIGPRRNSRNVEITTRQRRFTCPSRLLLGAVQIRRKTIQRLLGKPTVGRDLAAEDR